MQSEVVVYRSTVFAISETPAQGATQKSKIKEVSSLQSIQCGIWFAVYAMGWATPSLTVLLFTS